MARDDVKQQQEDAAHAAGRYVSICKFFFNFGLKMIRNKI